MSRQHDFSRGSRPPPAEDFNRYPQSPVNGRRETPPVKHGKVTRDSPIISGARTVQEKPARRKRHLFSIEGHSVVVPIYLLLPIICILVYVPIGVYTICVLGAEDGRASVGDLEKCIAQCEMSTTSLLADGLAALHTLKDTCIHEKSSAATHSCTIDKESLKDLYELQSSMKTLERKMKAIAGIVQDKDFSSALDLLPDPLTQYKVFKYSPKKESKECKDHLDECQAMLKAGDCEDSPYMMLEACPQSCGFCIPKRAKEK